MVGVSRPVRETLSEPGAPIQLWHLRPLSYIKYIYFPYRA